MDVNTSKGGDPNAVSEPKSLESMLFQSTESMLFQSTESMLFQSTESMLFQFNESMLFQFNESMLLQLEHWNAFSIEAHMGMLNTTNGDIDMSANNPIVEIRAMFYFDRKRKEFMDVAAERVRPDNDAFIVVEISGQLAESTALFELLQRAVKWHATKEVRIPAGSSNEA